MSGSIAAPLPGGESRFPRLRQLWNWISETVRAGTRLKEIERFNRACEFAEKYAVPFSVLSYGPRLPQVKSGSTINDIVEEFDVGTWVMLPTTIVCPRTGRKVVYFGCIVTGEEVLAGQYATLLNGVPSKWMNKYAAVVER